MMTLCLVYLNCCLYVLVLPVLAPDLPVVTVQSDDTRITQSCRIEIPPDRVLKDATNDGVIQIVASDIIVEFAPEAVLRGAAPDAAPDTYEGYGVRLAGQHDVTIRGGRISGFRAGVWASDVARPDARKDGCVRLSPHAPALYSGKGSRRGLALPA